MKKLYGPGCTLVSLLVVLCTLSLRAALATENGASVYPIGVDTSRSGISLVPGKSAVYMYSSFYIADEAVNSDGVSTTPGFSVRVNAESLKYVHVWNLQTAHARFGSSIVVPLVYERLQALSHQDDKAGIGNIAVDAIRVGFRRGAWHWMYYASGYFPGVQYNKAELVNIGQHNFAYGPGMAFTYAGKQCRCEASANSRLIFNLMDHATSYRSGTEATNEFAGLVKLTRHTDVGLAGFAYTQLTDDKQEGSVYRDGHRGRDFAFGPQLRINPREHVVVSIKYFHDALVENRARGQAFWLQVAFLR